VITIHEQVVPSAVIQPIIVKLVTNGKVKPAEIMKTAQFGDETLSRIQLYGRKKSFKEGREEV
jgi:hypothetical protein